jgi:signal transduction histidine kinase
VDQSERQRSRSAGAGKKQSVYRFQGGTTKGGSGLGLAISAELIRGHGGHLSLEKSDAQGSIFAIKLPKANI